MKKQFQDEGYNQYLTIELEKRNNMEQNMLLNNEIQGLLPCRIRTIDGGDVLDYQIDGRISFKDFIEQTQVDKEVVIILIQGIMKTVQNLRAYLLRPDGILMDLDAIYLKEEQREMEFCYVPGFEQNLMKQLAIIIETLMKQLNHKDEKSVLFVYGLYRLLEENNTSISTVKEFLVKEKRRSEEEELSEISIIKVDPHKKENIIEHSLKNEQEQKNDFIYAKKINKKVHREASKKTRKEIKKESKKETKKKLESKEEINKSLTNNQICEGKNKWLYLMLQVGSIGLLFVFLFFTVVFFWKGMLKNGGIGIIFIVVDLYFIYERRKEQKINNNFLEKEGTEIEKTILLSEMPQEETQYYPYLVSEQRGKERILIAHTPLVVGCLSEAVDYVIMGKGISRIHASIEQEAGKYYIRDLNSTNGTYWNGELLMPQVPKELGECDRIILGDQQFRFCLEEG